MKTYIFKNKMRRKKKKERITSVKQKYKQNLKRMEELKTGVQLLIEELKKARSQKPTTAKITF